MSLKELEKAIKNQHRKRCMPSWNRPTASDYKKILENIECEFDAFKKQLRKRQEKGRRRREDGSVFGEENVNVVEFIDEVLGKDKTK